MAQGVLLAHITTWADSTSEGIFVSNRLTDDRPTQAPLSCSERQPRFLHALVPIGRGDFTGVCGKC